LKLSSCFFPSFWLRLDMLLVWEKNRES
jgi:hypothetical protein